MDWMGERGWEGWEYIRLTILKDGRLTAAITIITQILIFGLKSLGLRHVEFGICDELVLQCNASADNSAAIRSGA